MRATRTYATLAVPFELYSFVHEALVTAGYSHAFDARNPDTGPIEMDGIALVPISEQNCPGHIASHSDAKVCAMCGTHVDSYRPYPEDEILGF